MQGGGTNQENQISKDAEKKITVCMHFPMEVVSVSEKLHTVELGSLTMIPSESQVRQAISMLCKGQDDINNKFTYIKFPFGMMNYDGLKTIQAYHESVQSKQRMNEERDWLYSARQIGSRLKISMTEIDKYFQKMWTAAASSPIQNLVGNRWLTDSDIDSIFQIINKKYHNIVAFVCKPRQCMYSSAGLRDKVTQCNGTCITKIIIALNVGREENGTCYVSNEGRSGIHWSLLIIDINKHTAYYGDSLAWPLPTNLTNIVESSSTLVLADLGINIKVVGNPPPGKKKIILITNFKIH